MKIIIKKMRSVINFKVRTLLLLFGQLINKYMRMNTSVNLEFLTEMSQHFGRANAYTRKEIDI